MAFNWVSFFKICLLLLLLAATTTAFLTLPVEKILKDFLLWVEQDLGPWGPLALSLVWQAEGKDVRIADIQSLVSKSGDGHCLGWSVMKMHMLLVRVGFRAVAYIPLTVMAVPASVLTLGGGYLFGLPVGFVADSIGATLGAVAAFLLGKTIGRSYVTSKLKDYPQFRAVAIAIQRSGFKIVLLLRLVPVLPFNMLNYLLCVTPVPLGEYTLASWLGMMPITFALVYVGTTLKDLSDVTHGWHEFSKARWALIISGLVMSVVLLICVTKVAKTALDKALAESEDIDSVVASPELPIVADPTADLHEPLMMKIDPPQDDHEK